MPLHTLCESHEALLETVEYLIKAFPSALSTRDSNGAFPLHVLCGTPSPSLKCVECLIKANPAALSTRTTISGDLPITLACESASLEVIYTLLRDYAEVVSS